MKLRVALYPTSLSGSDAQRVLATQVDVSSISTLESAEALYRAAAAYLKAMQVGGMPVADTQAYNDYVEKLRQRYEYMLDTDQ